MPVLKRAESVTIEWLEDGGCIPRIGRRVKGVCVTVDQSIGLDCIKKKWAKKVSGPKIHTAENCPAVKDIKE